MLAFCEAVARERLDLVYAVTATVVPIARVPFRVLVGENAPHRFQNRHRSEVLGGDQLDIVLLAFELLPDELADGRVGLRQG